MNTYSQGVEVEGEEREVGVQLPGLFPTELPRCLARVSLQPRLLPAEFLPPTSAQAGPLRLTWL